MGRIRMSWPGAPPILNALDGTLLLGLGLGQARQALPLPGMAFNRLAPRRLPPAGSPPGNGDSSLPWQEPVPFWRPLGTKTEPAAPWRQEKASAGIDRRAEPGPLPAVSFPGNRLASSLVGQPPSLGAAQAGQDLSRTSPPDEGIFTPSRPKPAQPARGFEGWSLQFGAGSYSRSQRRPAAFVPLQGRRLPGGEGHPQTLSPPGASDVTSGQVSRIEPASQHAPAGASLRPFAVQRPVQTPSQLASSHPASPGSEQGPANRIGVAASVGRDVPAVGQPAPGEASIDLPFPVRMVPGRPLALGTVRSWYGTAQEPGVAPRRAPLGISASVPGGSSQGPPATLHTAGLAAHQSLPDSQRLPERQPGGGLPPSPARVSSLIERLVEREVRVEVRRQAERRPVVGRQPPPESGDSSNATSQTFDLSDDGLVRALMARMQVLAQEERFRMGLIR